MKSKLVLVLWCINLCSKLAASIPFYEDSAQHIVGAQQASGLLSNVLENNNANSQLENLVALRHSFNPDIINPSGIGSIEQEQATTLEQQGDTRWHALSRAGGFPSVPQDLKAPARYQALPMINRGENIRPGASLNQMSNGQPQAQTIHQNLRQPSNAPMQQLPFIRQPLDAQPNQRPLVRQPFVRQAVKENSNQLPFIRQPDNVQLPFIRRPEGVESTQQYPLQHYDGPSNVESSRQPSVPLNQQISRQPFPPKPFVPFRAETFEKTFSRPAEILPNQQFFTKHVNNQELLQPQQSTKPPPGMNNLQQIIASNELKKVMASKPKSRYIVVYPNGTVEYVNQLEAVAKNYPNYLMLNGYKAATASNIQLESVTPQMQNIGGQQPSNPAHYVTSLESQIPANNIKIQHDGMQTRSQNNFMQTQTQSNVVQTQTQNNSKLKIETTSNSWTPSTIELETTPAVTIGTEIVSLPSEFEIEEIPVESVETGIERSDITIMQSDDKREIEILNTSYPISNLQSNKEPETQSTDSTNSSSNDNDNQSAQLESNNDQNQSQDRNKVNSQSTYEPEEEELIVHTETTYTLLDTQYQEQSESNFSEEDHSDKEQQQTQTSQEQTQKFTESPTQSTSSTQQTQNESTSNSQALTQSSASSSSATSSTPKLTTRQPSQTESVTSSQSQTHKNNSESSSKASDLALSLSQTESTTSSQSQTRTNNSESSSKAPDLALNKSIPTKSGTNKAVEGQGATGEDKTGKNTNDHSKASSESQSQSQSSNNKQLNNATSEAKSQARPLTWFTTQDPDFLEKLIGKDVVGMVYFFVIPANSQEYDD